MFVSCGSVLTLNSTLGDGGAIYSTGACFGAGIPVTLDAAIIDGNQAGGAGGAIACLGGGVVITNGSLLTANWAEETGGGVFNAGGSVTVLGASCFTSNSSQIGDGGAIAHVVVGQVLLGEACVVSNNSAGGRGGGISNADLENRGSVLVSESSVIEGNSASEPPRRTTPAPTAVPASSLIESDRNCLMESELA